MLKLGTELEQLIKSRDVITATASHTTSTVNYEQLTLIEKHKTGNKLLIENGKVKISHSVSLIIVSAATYFNGVQANDNLCLRITKNGVAEVTMWDRAGGNNDAFAIPNKLVSVSEGDTIELEARSSSNAGATLNNAFLTIEVVN